MPVFFSRLDMSVQRKRNESLQNEQYASIPLKELVGSLPRNQLTFVMGIGDSGQIITHVLPQLGQLVLLGRAGTGKTRLLQAILCQLLATNDPAHLQVVLLDPFGIDLKLFDDCPHLYRGNNPLQLPALVGDQPAQEYPNTQGGSGTPPTMWSWRKNSRAYNGGRASGRACK
jgi:FtsK/SpoIIIE family